MEKKDENKTKKPCRLLENNAFFNGLRRFSINSLCSAKLSDCDSKCKRKSEQKEENECTNITVVKL